MALHSPCPAMRHAPGGAEEGLHGMVAGSPCPHCLLTCSHVSGLLSQVLNLQEASQAQFTKAAFDGSTHYAQVRGAAWQHLTWHAPFPALAHARPATTRVACRRRSGLRSSWRRSFLGSRWSFPCETPSPRPWPCSCTTWATTGRECLGACMRCVLHMCGIGRRSAADQVSRPPPVARSCSAACYEKTGHRVYSCVMESLGALPACL